MARCGFASEEEQSRPYHPHITLARFRGPFRLSKTRQILLPSLQRSFTGDTVNLYRSRQTPTGSHYEILAQNKGRQPK
jgi:2'-5' RNA ligase